MFVRRIVKKYNINDKAIGRLALIVRGADTPRRDLTPESPGLEAIAEGFRRLAAAEGHDDHETIRRERHLYDALYLFCGGDTKKLRLDCVLTRSQLTPERLVAIALRLLGHIELPAHRSTGGFDHADIHLPTNRIYVAHTSNDSVDVIDCGRDRYIESIPDLIGVAGALVSETRGLVFTSNRGENTVSVFAPCDEQNAFKIAVGVKPNGLAFDPTRNILIAANVGDASIPDSCSVSVVDVERRERIAEVKVPGRTRWAIYDAALEMFFVNIASPPRIAAID